MSVSVGTCMYAWHVWGSEDNFGESVFLPSVKGSGGASQLLLHSSLGDCFHAEPAFYSVLMFRTERAYD